MIWHQITSDALSGEFQRLDNVLAQAGINYASYGHPGVYFSDARRPHWNNVYTLMEKHGLASNDAAILNMCTNAVHLDGET